MKNEPIPLTPFQCYFLDKKLAKHYWANSEYRLLDGPIDEKVMNEAIKSVYDRHNALRIKWLINENTTSERYSGVYGTLSPAEEKAPTLEKQTQKIAIDNKEALRTIVLPFAKRHTISYPHMASFLEFPASDTQSLFVVLLCHFVGDIASINILTNEVLTQYKHLVKSGELSPMPPVLQLTDYANFINQYARSRKMEEDLVGMKQRFSQSKNSGQWHTLDEAKPGDEGKNYVQFDYYTLENHSLINQLLSACDKNGVKFPFVFLTAWARAIYQVSGIPGYGVKLVKAGRWWQDEKLDFTGTIGSISLSSLLYIENTDHELFENARYNQDLFKNFRDRPGDILWSHIECYREFSKNDQSLIEIRDLYNEAHFPFLFNYFDDSMGLTKKDLVYPFDSPRSHDNFMTEEFESDGEMFLLLYLHSGKLRLEVISDSRLYDRSYLDRLWKSVASQLHLCI